MTISINVQNISKAKVRTYNDKFSTVDVECGDGEVALFFSGKNHQTTAEAIATHINAQVGFGLKEEEGEECP